MRIDLRYDGRDVTVAGCQPVDQIAPSSDDLTPGPHRGDAWIEVGGAGGAVRARKVVLARYGLLCPGAEFLPSTGPANVTLTPSAEHPATVSLLVARPADFESITWFDARCDAEARPVATFRAR